MIISINKIFIRKFSNLGTDAILTCRARFNKESPRPEVENDLFSLGGVPTYKSLLVNLKKKPLGMVASRPPIDNLALFRGQVYLYPIYPYIYPSRQEYKYPYFSYSP